MPAIRIFEPALCCNTGVCGPDVDQSLIDFTAALGAVRDAGGDVERANLASDPAAFTADPTALAFLQTAGSQGLPLTVVDGVTVLTGRYPSREELSRWAGLDAAPYFALTAKLAREHNNAQLIGIGGRMHTEEEALAIVDAFVAQPWSEEERHQRRIDILADYERTGVAPQP